MARASSASALPMLLLLLLQLQLAARSARAGDSVCAFVPEPTAATLACPPGEIISGFSFATFGTFAPDSSCAAGLAPLAACPVSVLAQAGRLCTGAASCSISCDCIDLPSPCGCNATAASLAGATLRLAFPGVPCSGVAKQLGLIASCAPALPPPAPQPAPATPAPTGLLLEFMPSPVLGLDNLRPHFAWTPPASAARLPPGAVQTAARVVVTTFPGGAAVWDSGAVASSAPLLVPSTPLPLASDTQYQWTVASADGSGVWSPASAPARFGTGLLAPADWAGAAWIGGWRAGTLLRKDFTVAAGAPAARVSVFVSACQYYLLFIDGVRVGQRELDVMWTRFQYFRSYATYELDPALLPPGPHTLGLALGQGFCGQSGGKAGNHTSQGLLRLALYAADGSLLQPAVVTDTSWSSGSGPVLTDSTYFGEQYNASMEQPGWAAPGFVPPPGAPAWRPAVLANDPPVAPQMSSQLMPAIERVEELGALSITAVDAPGVQRYTFDFGQEIAGRVRLALPPGVPAGTNITIKHTEVYSHPPSATLRLFALCTRRRRKGSLRHSMQGQGAGSSASAAARAASRALTSSRSMPAAGLLDERPRARGASAPGLHRSSERAAHRRGTAVTHALVHAVCPREYGELRALRCRPRVRARSRAARTRVWPFAFCLTTCYRPRRLAACSLLSRCLYQRSLSLHSFRTRARSTRVAESQNVSFCVPYEPNGARATHHTHSIHTRPPSPPTFR